MIPLTQHARHVAAKAADLANDPKAMFLPAGARSFLTDLGLLLMEMAQRIDNQEKKNNG